MHADIAVLDSQETEAVRTEDGQVYEHAVGPAL